MAFEESVSLHWALFHDWCIAADQTALPASPTVIAQFFQEVPAAASTQAKRLQAIRRVHREHGEPLALPEAVPASPWREGEGWLDLNTTIARCPASGWTAGLAGRRDAFLAVLIGACRLTREQARTVTGKDIRQRRDGSWAIHGQQLEVTPEPAECPACAVVRWLTVLDLWDGWGRSSLRSHLASARRNDEHVCMDAHEHGGLVVQTLLPAIDKYGWLADWEPISAADSLGDPRVQAGCRSAARHR